MKMFAVLFAATLLFWRVAVAQDLPLPPAQASAWTVPKTSLPESVVSATSLLFEEGMSDPRGCDYREIEIFKTQYDTIKTHGWVLPDTGEKHYAVGWNGLVYLVSSVGAAVDLRAEFAAMKSDGGRREFPHRFYQTEEQGSLDPTRAQPLQIALLLRLGEASLAEQVWREGAAGRPDAERNALADMAHVWLARWFTRALEAYSRDDYPATLAICRRLAPAEQKIREEAIRQGTPDPWPDTAEREILWQLPVLEAEANRRVGELPYTPVFETSHPPEGAERIAALIRDLERVRVHVMMSPGQTEVSDDLVVRALVKEGPPAVEPLLRCLVDDNRLTRTRYGYRTYEGPVIPVYECAYIALFQILQTSVPMQEKHLAGFRQSRDIRHFDREDRRNLAAKLAAVWARQKDRPVMERAYDTLRDDHASAREWLQAVDNLVQPNDGLFTEYRLVRPPAGYGIRVNPAPFTSGGEALRSRTDPSVSELIVKRFDDLLQADDPEHWGFDNPMFLSTGETLGKLLLSLADWDGKTHLDDLRRLQGELVEHFRRLTITPVKREGQGQDRYEAGNEIIRVFEKRLDLGDDRALAEYVDFLQPLSAKSFGTTWGSVTGNFRLLWRHPDDPVIIAAAEKMFGQDSAWVPFTRSYTHNLADLIHTPLIALPAFRRELLRGLGDPAAAGVVELGENGNVNDGSSRFYPLDPLAPPKGSKIAYRLCDHYAHELSFLDGFPECELYWPETDRDRAVAACRAFLEHHADDFRYREQEDKGRDDPIWFLGGPPIHFPVLDHPATPEDVEAGRAVFSLPAPARVCQLPGLPLMVERPSHPVDPYGGIDRKGRQSVSYHTGGKVWQVEETLVEGKWERFYGFVGRYQFERVPAAEITFGADQGTGRITPAISGSIETAIRSTNNELLFGNYADTFVVPGSSVPIRIRVHNRSAWQQTLPGAVIFPPGPTRMLPHGVRLSLSYSAKVPPRIKDYKEPPFDYGTWQEAPLRAGDQAPAFDAAEVVMSPGQDLTLADLDLRDYFDLSRTGSYQIRVVFRVLGQAESTSNDMIFSLAP